MSTVIGWLLVTCLWSNSNVSRPWYNRPFAGSSYMVQNKLCWDANDAVGLWKQKKFGLDWYKFLCFGGPTASFASQYNLFRTMWLDPAKGLLRSRCSHVVFVCFWWNRELTLKCKFKCLLNPWITHWALALVKGIREPHEVKKKSFDLGGNRTHDLRIRSTVTLPTELRGRTEKVGDD